MREWPSVGYILGSGALVRVLGVKEILSVVGETLASQKPEEKLLRPVLWQIIVNLNTIWNF